MYLLYFNPKSLNIAKKLTLCQQAFCVYWFIKRIDLKAEKVCIDLNSSKELQKNGPKAEKYMYLV